MDWIVLVIAGLLETFWAWEMNLSEGFTLLPPSILTLVGLVGSMTLLAIAMRTIPLPIAYATWTGIGIAGTAAVSAATGTAALNLPQIICLACIVFGTVGLNAMTVR
jgi:quaternary ammonium compound-resistance protein SugE